MMKLVRAINHVFVIILLFIFYFVGIGLGSAIQGLFQDNKKNKQTYWEEPEKGEMDMRSAY